MAVIDFHTHVFSDAVATDRQYYVDADPIFRDLYSDEKASIATVDQLIGAMDQSGIERSVVCGFGWSTHSLCVEGNDAVIDAVGRYPDRLIGLGTVVPGPDTNSLIAEIRRIKTAGLFGLGELRPDGQGWLELQSETLSKISAEVRAQKFMLLFHTSEPLGHSYAGKERTTPERLAHFLQALKGIPTVLAHAGGGYPFYAYMPEVAEDLADVYVDTAALPFLYGPMVLDALVAAHGPDRILFGTDFPLVDHDRALRYIDDSGLNPDHKAKLIGGNAEALLSRLSTYR
jgi:predicted TIM-barrel fold metal-dependent hydrolase